MRTRIPMAVLLCTATVFAPLIARADNFGYYTPPKVKVRGSTQAPILAGTVVVKVFVKADGSVGSASVISVKKGPQSNTTPALDIAKTSTYVPATRGPKKVAAFYDYTLNFQAGKVAATDDYSALNALLQKNDYKGAADGATAYLQSHPTDAQALGILAVADYFQKDYSGSVAAFEKGATVPPTESSIKLEAYNNYIEQQLEAKDWTSAVSASHKLVSLSDTYNTRNTLGFAELNSGDSADALTDLGRARDLAKADTKVKPGDIGSIDLNLEQAEIAAGKVDDAKAIMSEIRQIDPGPSTVPNQPSHSDAAQNVLANYYSKAAGEKATAKQYGEAAALYETAAQALPSSSFASTFYTSAAYMYLQLEPKPDNTKAKADADKAIAADPTNGKANYAAGIALANDGKASDAITYLKKAEDLAKSATPPDTALVAQVEAALTQVNKAK